MTRSLLPLFFLCLAITQATAQESQLPVKNGLVLWLDAQTLTASNGQPVAERKDGSGQGRHARQPDVARQPICRTDMLPGKKTPKVVYFDGQRTGLQISNANAQLEYYTIFVVAAPSSNHGGF